MLTTTELEEREPLREPLQEHKDVKVKVLADGKVLKVQKTRQRKVLSCVYCHSKKIKCSRVLPTCNNCEKLGIDCQYFANERISKGGKRKSLSTIKKSRGLSSPDQNTMSLRRSQSTSVSHSLETDITSGGETDELLPNLHDSVITPHIKSENGIDSSDLQDHKLLEGFGTNLPTVLRSLLQTPVMNNMNNITNSFFNNGTETTQDKEDLYSFNLSSFTYANYQANPQTYNKVINNEIHSGLPSHNNSTTNISSFFTKNSQLYPLSNIQLNLDKETPPQINSASFEIPIDNTRNFLNGANLYYDNENLLDDLETHLPTSKEKSFELIQRYVNSVHILLPIVPTLQDFLEEHDKYWAECNPYDKESNNLLTDLNLLQFYTLYFPILYAATISEFEEFDNLLLNQDINKYLRGFDKICQYYNYPHGLKIMPLLLGNVIIQSTSPNPSTMEMSLIIRYAKFLQMNKDPVLTLNIKDHEVINFRRLLWWTIFGLDCLTSHNFCLPPVCKFEDFNVQLPNEKDPIYNEAQEVIGYNLNTSTLSLNIKFRYDRILNELVSQLHSDNSRNISTDRMNEIKFMINDYFEYIHISINKMNRYHKKYPPKTVNEMNLVNFIKNHSWSFVDRATMLLHKKFLLNELNDMSDSGLSHTMLLSDSIDSEISSTKARSNSSISQASTYSIHLTQPRNGKLSLAQFEDTFQSIVESNIIKNADNFRNLNLNLNFNPSMNFSYNDMTNNLIPSILHNLNDFLKYNDFLKFGKYNWYVKRTIPLDSIILLFIIIIVKFKNEMIKFNELVIYVKLINKSLFILNRKWFKNEKYKRMLSLTNLTWEYILKKFKILQVINKFANSNFSINLTNKNKIFNKYEYFNYQLTGYVNTTELFKTMQVAQPVISRELINKLQEQRQKLIVDDVSSLDAALQLNHQDHHQSLANSPMSMKQESKLSLDLMDENFSSKTSPKLNLNYENDINLIETNEIIKLDEDFNITMKVCDEFQLDTNELTLLVDKIKFDLRNNYVDINDYCAFYISLENILHELINFIE